MKTVKNVLKDKRFGLNSASEQSQHHLQTLLAETSCVINITDDILIFASVLPKMT